MATKSKAQFDVQGHRGCRGILPENTIPAFLRAVQLGVTTLEMDVVITADNRVLVSHDPFMSHEICYSLTGAVIDEKEEQSFNIYKMTAEEAMNYDCGSKPHPRFVHQQKQIAHKPLLTEVIDSVERYVAKHGLSPVYYNIETKCTPAGDGIFHPTPEIFSDLLLHVIESKGITNRVIIQSFDVRTLQYIKFNKKPVRLALLVENTDGVTENINNLGFDPDIYSPYFELLTAVDVKLLHQKSIKVLPWTVNTVKDINACLQMGVDGLITDYPDKLLMELEKIK